MVAGGARCGRGGAAGEGEWWGGQHPGFRVRVRLADCHVLGYHSSILGLWAPLDLVLGSCRAAKWNPDPLRRLQIPFSCGHSTNSASSPLKTQTSRNRNKIGKKISGKKFPFFLESTLYICSFQTFSSANSSAAAAPQ